MTYFRDYIDQGDYCDESDLLINQYKKISGIEFQAEHDFLNKWLHEDHNNILLISGEKQSGKKVLLCQFIQKIKKQYPNWLITSHFGSITPIYSHVLYKILIEIRNFFKIQQRVDLNEQKLRRYFKYWLQVVSNFINKQYLGYNKDQKSKIIIIIQGIDYFKDLKGNLVNYEFWLPKILPSNIKMILTTQIKNQKIQNFHVLNHHLSCDLFKNIINKFNQKTINIYNQNKNITLYQLWLLDKIYQIKPNFKYSSQNQIHFLQNYINSVSSPKLDSDTIKSLLYLLSLSKKGLKLKWMTKIFELTQQQWGIFYRLFCFLLINHKQYFIIVNKHAIQIINKVTDPYNQKIKTYKQLIAKSIKNQPVHLRGLEQNVLQLLQSQSYPELKEVISRIQNFLMLFTPLTKNLLCQCWVKLQQLQQYDPVFQYNHAIQNYNNHYYPKQQDLFKIIFQVCMFFKQYSQFQNFSTPEFRHPLIKAQIQQLNQIGIYDQLKEMGMIGRCKIFKLRPITKKIMRKKKQDENNGQGNIQNLNKILMNNIKEEYQKKIQHYQETQQEGEQVQQSQQNRIEQINEEQTLNLSSLNINIIANQLKIRKYFINEIQEYLQNYFVPLKKSANKQKQLLQQSQQSQNQDGNHIKNQKQYKFDIQKIKQSFFDKKFTQYLEQNYHKTGQQVCYYYYKQWIWLQFPWLCQTVKNIYSHMIKQCLSGSIQYMSPTKEFTLIKQVLKIARNAKQSKLNIFNQKKIQIVSMRAERQQTRAYNKQNMKTQIRHFQQKKVSSQNKIKLNMTNIENLLKNEKLQSLKYQQKYGKQSRLIKNTFTFITQQNNQKSVKQSRLFPQLDKNSSIISSINNLNKSKLLDNKSRQYLMMVKKLNQLKHQNQNILLKIQQLKKNNNQDNNKDKIQSKNTTLRIKQLQKKRQVLQNKLKNQQQLQKKLLVIIKICNLNKMYGSQTDSLGSYLNSIKQMIKIQQSEISNMKKQMQNKLYNYHQQLKQLKKKKKQLKTARNSQLAYQYNFQNQQFLYEQIHGEDLYKKNHSKNKKTKKPHELSSMNVLILQNKFKIIYSQDSKNHECIEEITGKSQKVKQLRIKNNEIDQILRQKERIINGLKSQIYDAKKSTANIKMLNTNASILQKKNQLSDMKKRNQTIIYAINSFSNTKQTQSKVTIIG